MLSCARATRGLRRPSLDTRSGRPSSPPSMEMMEEQCSLDGRSRTNTGTLPTDSETGRQNDARSEGWSTHPPWMPLCVKEDALAPSGEGEG